MRERVSVVGEYREKEKKGEEGKRRAEKEEKSVMRRGKRGRQRGKIEATVNMFSTHR